MKKKTYLAYPIGTRVYAIIRHQSETDGEWEPDGFIKIEPAIIDEIYFTSGNKPQYYLKTLKGKDWGEEVPEDDIGTFKELMKRMKQYWKIKSIED